MPTSKPRVTTVISRVAYARGDRLRTSDDVTELDTLDGCRDVRAVRLEEESRLKSLSQQDKFLVYADISGDDGLNYYFDTGPDLDCPSNNSARLPDYFGRTHGRVVLDMWLTESSASESAPPTSEE